jgi:hypothetical protein
VANGYDQAFFDRADALIDLANQQCRSDEPGKVSASFMYAAARFGAWISASNCSSGSDLAAHREEALDYFTAQYRKMLAENLDDYIGRFAAYMRSDEH